MIEWGWLEMRQVRDNARNRGAEESSWIAVTSFLLARAESNEGQRSKNMTERQGRIGGWSAGLPVVIGHAKIK